MKIINHEKKEMLPLTTKENKSYHKQKVCYICKKEYESNGVGLIAIKLHSKILYVRDHCHYTGQY